MTDGTDANSANRHSATGLDQRDDATAKPNPLRLRLRGVRISTWLLGALILAQGLWIFSFNRRSYLLVDDYRFLQQAIESEVSITYLREDMFGHFSPLLRVVYKAMATLASGNFTAFAVVLTLFTMGLIASVAFMIRQITSRLLPLWYAVILVGLAIWTIRPAMVFTNGIHIMLATTFSTLTVAFFIRLCVTHDRRNLWIASALFLVAVLVQEKPLLLPLTLVLLRYAALVETQCPIRCLPRQILRDLPIWAPFFVIWILSAVNLLVFYRPDVPRASSSDIAALVELSMRAFVGSLAGFWNDIMDPPWRIAACWAVVLLMVAFVSWTSWTRSGAWLVWATFGAVYLANFTLLAWGRVGLYGPGIALDAQYYVEVGVCWVMCVALALRRPRRVTNHERLNKYKNWPEMALISILIAIFIPHVIATTPRYFDQVIGYASSTRDYFTGGESGLDRLRLAGIPFDLVPTLAPPGYVFPGVGAPYTELENVLRIFRMPVDPSPRGDRPVIIDEFGTLRDTRANVLNTWSAGSDSNKQCLRLQPTGGESIPIPARSDSSGLWVALKYNADSQAVVQVTGVSDGVASDTLVPTTLTPEGHLALARMNGPAVDHVEIRLIEGGPVCIAQASAVELVAGNEALPDSDPNTAPTYCWLLDQSAIRVGQVDCPAPWREQFSL